MENLTFPLYRPSFLFYLVCTPCTPMLGSFEEKASDMMTQLETALVEQSSSAKGNFYQTVCDTFFEQYLMDGFCNKVIRLLLIEQFNNSTIQELYEHWMFTEPIAFQSKVFSALMQADFIRNADSEYLAIKYYAPIYFFAQRWLFSGALSKERKNDFRTNAYQHVQNFFAEIGGA